MHKRKYILLAFLIIFCLSASAHAMNIYRCGDVITGQEYNDAWKKWFDKKLSVWVGAEGKKGFIFVEAETGLGDAVCKMEYGGKTVSSLKTLIAKAQKWAKIARENKADTSKSLGCFVYRGYRTTGMCAEEGFATSEGEMGFSFFAANGGRQTNLIVSIIDRDNQFKKATIYLDEQGMSALLKAVRAIDAEYGKALEMQKKDNLFQ